MICLLIIVTAACLIISCGEKVDDQGDYQYGVMKSDPPMLPLTYTWSHPECPFTVEFPGEPEVEKYTDPPKPANPIAIKEPITAIIYH